MTRLYHEKRRIPFIEGSVTRSTQIPYLEKHAITRRFETEEYHDIRTYRFVTNRPLLSLEIDSFNGGNLVIPDFYYRIDVGEKVRLYSIKDFKRGNKDNPEIFICGVQVLADKTKVKFQSVHLEGLVFK